MNIFMIGDMHLGLGFPSNYDRWNLIAKNYINSFLLPFLRKNVKEGDVIIQMGDLFHDRNTIPIGSLNLAQDLIIELSKIAPTHFIIGNHDLWNINSRDINSLKLYSYIPNVHIYSEPTVVDINGVKLGFMPYIHHKEEQIDAIKKIVSEGGEYLFAHSDLNGAKMHLTSIAHKNFDKIDLDDFKGFKHVYSGHIHIEQKFKNFTFVGSTYAMDRNDYGNQKGIYVLNVEKNKDKFFPNTTSPIFEKIYILKEEDIVKFEDIDNNNFNDLYISNTLISDKKTARRINAYLNSGLSFELVEYVDDSIIEEALVTDIDTSDIINLNFDYVSKIKESIDSNTYQEGFSKDKLIDTFNLVNDKYQELKNSNQKIK
jgi:DNA repair exonuclease SbcCD nuclease subunit